MVHKCPGCGFDNAAAKNFCDVCGDRLDYDPASVKKRSAADFKPDFKPIHDLPSKSSDSPPEPAPEPDLAPEPERAPEPEPAPRPEPAPERREDPPPRIELPKIPQLEESASAEEKDGKPDIRLPKTNPPLAEPPAKAPETKAQPKPKEAGREPDIRPSPTGKPPPEEDFLSALPKTVIRSVGESPPAPKKHPPLKEPAQDKTGPPEQPAPERKERPADKKEERPPKKEESIKRLPPDPDKKPLYIKADATVMRGKEERFFKDDKERRRREKEKEREAARREADRAERKRREREKEKERARRAHRVPPSEGTLRRIQSRPVFSTLLGLFLLISGAVAYGVMWRLKRDPAKMALKTAGDYLFALKQKDYPKAYALLSAATKKTCSLDRFAALQDQSVWTFDDLKVDGLSDSSAFLKFNLLASGKNVVEDWLHFVKENGEWRRAYWWHLMDPIEDAIAAGDYPTALQGANAAAAINPLDPMTHAYLCETAYFLGNHSAAAASCRKALVAYKKFPSRLAGPGIFRLHQILADIYRHYLRQPAEAEKEYGIALAFPMLSAADRCGILIARGDLRRGLNRFEDALADFRQAQNHCAGAADSTYTRRAVRVLSGEAGPEAVQALQQYQMPGTDGTVLAWREASRAELTRKLKTRSSSLEKERWTPAHESGSVYRVAIRDDVTEVLTAKVDLWTHDIKVDIHVR